MYSDDEFIESKPEYEDQHGQSDDDEYKHKSLVEKISNLNVPSKVKRKKVRTEPRDIHELNLIKQDDKLDLEQLTNKITDSTNNNIITSIRRFSKKINRKKVLDVPLEKVHKNRLERNVLFKETSKEVSKWEPIVLQNRVADQLTFPLKEPELKLENNEQIAKKFKPKTDFEKEIHDLLTSSENYLNDEQPLTEAEERALRAMSIEEARAKHKELRHQRALLSYQEAKLNRQNKIKSKSYRKLKKREKLKKTMKEFEELKKTDPQKALEKLQELDKIRIKERTTLKHLNTGKWAKFNKLRAKNDSETRQKLSEQIDLNKQLVKKLFEESDEDDEELNVELNNSDDEYDEKANALLKLDKNEYQSNMNETNTNEMNQDSELMFKQNYDNLIEKMNVEELEEMMRKKKKQNKKKEQQPQQQNKITEIEDDERSEESDLESDSDLDEANYRKLISEALAEDDAVEEFSKEKKEVIEKEKGKTEDTFLPGWGSWAGDGIKISKKRRNKFIKRAPEVMRKDQNFSNVIISEKKDEILNKYIPKTLPPGVKDFKNYQKKLTRPVGSNWNPEKVFKNLIEPKVITKRGKIIEPMDQDALTNVRKFTDRKDFKSKLSQLIKID